MTARPILFSAPMVRALLAGRKTQTRRIVRGLEECPHGYDQVKRIVQQEDYFLFSLAGGDHRVRSPYGMTGDQLWVRETCRAKELSDEEAISPRYIHHGAPFEKPPYGLDGVEYLADGEFRPIHNSREASDRWMTLNDYGGRRGRAVPGIHMPRWACRLTLDVTGVRVERLQAISQRDAKAEGCAPLTIADGGFVPTTGSDYIGAYRHLWDEINAARAPWRSNPWVWVVAFKVARP